MEEPEVLGDGERFEHGQERDVCRVGPVLGASQRRVLQGHVQPLWLDGGGGEELAPAPADWKTQSEVDIADDQKRIHM